MSERVTCHTAGRSCAALGILPFAIGLLASPALAATDRPINEGRVARYQANAAPQSAPPAEHSTPPEDQASPPVPPAAAADPTQQLGTVPGVATIGSDDQSSKWKRFDSLAQQGIIVSYPPARDSALGDLGGLRDVLADHDISLALRSTNAFAYDVLQNNRPDDPQLYNGQKFTVNTFSPHFVLTAGLDRLGLKDADFIFSVMSLHSSWTPNGPSETAIRILAYYQSFFDKKVELKIGYTPNLFEFVGVFTAASPTLASGLSGVLPIQAGLSADPVTAPTVNLTLNGGNGTYFKGAIQRSRSPAGAAQEADNNHFGLRFNAERSKALYIGEVGVRRPATDGGKQLWLRAGMLYNTSDYTDLRDGQFRDNKNVYALGDFQVSQIDASRPHRGFYFGGSAMWADPKVNVYTQYYEARVYGLGIFESRPGDSVSLSANMTKFSDHARDSFGLRGISTVGQQIVATATYSAHIYDGVYLSPNISYIHHPSFSVVRRDALNAALVLFTQF